jgi:phosphoribosylanthranilate isomerase
VRIKVCGVTRPEDARAASELGAWAVGMILSPRGPRFVSVARARLVRASIPKGVLAVGVFVDESQETVNRLARELALDLVQLHGDEPSSFLDGLERPAIKALTVDGAVPDLVPWTDAFALLFEGKERGRPFDWDLASSVAEDRRLLVAGGLTAQNAAEAARRTRPFALDVSSGVELAPGVKDARALRDFFEALS